MVGRQNAPDGQAPLRAQPPSASAFNGNIVLAPHPPSVPRINADDANRLSAMSPTTSLTFPLRPAHSPKVTGGRVASAASRKPRAKGGHSNGTSSCWFSSSARCFLVPVGASSGHGPATSPAQRPREHFQKLPVFSGVGPMARGSLPAAARELAVPILVQEPLASGAHGGLAGPSSSLDVALVRRLRAEVKQMRSVIALQHRAALGAPAAPAPQQRPVAAGSAGKPDHRDADERVEQLRVEFEAERSRVAEHEEGRLRAESLLEEERARAAAAAKAASEEQDALRMELEEMRRTLEAERAARQAGAAEGPPSGAEASGTPAQEDVSLLASLGPSEHAQAAGAGGVGGAGEQHGGDEGTGGGCAGGPGAEGAAEEVAHEAEGEGDPHDVAEEGGGVAGLWGHGSEAQSELASEAATKLAHAVDFERLTAETAFDAIAADYGELSLPDLAAAAARVGACETRAEAEALFSAMGGEGTDGKVSREGWCRVLSATKVGFSRQASAKDLDLSIDLSSGASREGDPWQRTRGERARRAMLVVAVALKVQCRDRVGEGFFGDGGISAGDLDTLARKCDLDVSPEDVETLASHLASADGSTITAERWREAVDAEESAVETIVGVLTIVASGLVWDIRTVFDAFPSKAPGDAKALAPPAATRSDLTDMNDTWQFCLSHGEIDGWLSYMDASHNGRVTMRSWVRALAPFCAAIGAIGFFLHGMMQDKELKKSVELFERFDADDDGKLTPEELLDSFRHGSDGLQYPKEHVRVFHKHLTYFTETDDKSVFPSHWSAAFDLIECDVVQNPAEEEVEELSMCPNGHALQHHTTSHSSHSCDMCQRRQIDKGTGILRCKLCDYDACDICVKDKGLRGKSSRAGVKDYSEVFQRMQRAVATEQLAVLLLRSCEGQQPSPVDVLASADQDSGPLVIPDVSFEEMQWRLLLTHGEAAPPFLVGHAGGESDKGLRVELKEAVRSLLKRLATRGSQLLVVLLAAHKLPIESAYAAFCGGRDAIKLGRFKHILHLLAPDFGAISPRAECLFLSLTDEGSVGSTISEVKWVLVLEKAADHLSNRQYIALLKAKGADAAAAVAPQGGNPAAGDAKSTMTYGERQRLCDVFFNNPGHGGSTGAEGSSSLLKSSLFINEQQLSLALAKMGVFAKRNQSTIADSEAKPDTQAEIFKHVSKPRRKRRFRRGGGGPADKGGADKVREEGSTTLWDFEREVERSRVASTFEQLQLPQVFADALCDEMQPQKGICTPLAMEHLQSQHLMSWMLSLGEERLRELLGRMYELKRQSIVDQLAASILHFQTKHEAQTNMNMNSKYSTWSSTFAGTLRKASFGKLDDFKKGLDATLGMPSFNIMAQMRREHCNMHNSRTVFAPPNNAEIETCAADEWNYVVNFDPTKEYAAGDDRTGGTIHYYMSKSQAKKARLTTEEVIALRLYSGPMYFHYNKVLRGQDDKQYVTTIHAIVSAIIKLASIMKLPANRKVYRGLSGIELPPEFWQEDEYGAKGGVEFGIMSTTRQAHVAVQYSSYGEIPTIFEIEIGQVDRGAELNWISQFPGEEEVVMPPLSNLEVTGDPYLKRLEGKLSQILIVPLRVNVNIKSKTMEELEATRKGVLLSGIMDMKTVSEQEIGELAQSLGTIQAIAAGQETEWFNDQVAHLQVIQEKSADKSSSQGFVVKTKRLDLLETVAMRVQGSGVEAVHAGDKSEARQWSRHMAAKMTSLEQRMWALSVSKAPSAAKTSHSAELEKFSRAHALHLEVAVALVPELADAKTAMQDGSAALHDADDFHCKTLLDLHREVVGVLSVSMGKIMSSESLSWHRGESKHLDLLPIDLRRDASVAVFPEVNSVRTIMSTNTLDRQHALEFRLEAPRECLVAVGIFPDEAFEMWRRGKWRLPSKWTPARGVEPSKWTELTMCPKSHGALQHDTAVRGYGCDMCKRQFAKGTGVLHCRSCAYDICDICVKDKGLRGKSHQAGVWGEDKSAILNVEGGGFIMVVRLPPRKKSSDGASQDAVHKFATSLKKQKKDAESSFDLFDLDKDGKISIGDMKAAKPDGQLNMFSLGVSPLDVFHLLKGEDGFISREAWINAIGASQAEAAELPPAQPDAPDDAQSNDRPWDTHEGILTLEDGSTIGLVLDTKRNCASFSLGSRLIGRALLEGGSNFHAAAAVLQGSSLCSVRIESAPAISWHRAHMHITPKIELDKEVKELQSDASELQAQQRKELKELLRDHAKAAGEDAKVADKDAKASEDKKAKQDDGAEEGAEAPKDTEDDTEVKGLGGSFFQELVDKVGDERACVEFKAMLDSWKSAGYDALEIFKEAAVERADVIKDCRASLKSVYNSYTDVATKEVREKEYTQSRASLTIQTQILHFLRKNPLSRCRALKSRMCLSRSSDDEAFTRPREAADSQHAPTHDEMWKDMPRVEEASYDVLRGYVQDLDSIAVSLLNVVIETFNGVEGHLQEASSELGPGLEVLERIDKIISGLSSSLNLLQDLKDALRQLWLDIDAADSLRGNASSNQQLDLNSAYRRGGIAAKQEQAKSRSEAAQETFERLSTKQQKFEVSARVADIRHKDLIWMCNPSINPELWLLSLFDAEHADRVSAWLNRQCVGSELLRMVSRLDDNTLQQTHCQRRFNAVLQTIEAACSVLPLTSEASTLPTKRRFASVKNDVKHKLDVLRGANEGLEKTVRAIIEDGEARIHKRWNIGVHKKVDDAAAESKEEVKTLDPESDESRWEFRRAESRYWQAMMLLYAQAREMAAAKASHKDREGSDALRQRSVARCLELLDDTVYAPQHPAGASQAPSSDFAELHLDDALDQWEARVQGMLSLRQNVCKLNASSVVSSSGSLSAELPLSEIATGSCTELSLCNPDSKLAAFVACFVARSSQNNVSVYVRDKDGKKSSMEAPIILVPGGGLAAHVSANEVNAKMLDFGSKGLTVYGLRLLVEAARSDEDVLDATIAGVNDFDLSEDGSRAHGGEFAESHFNRKSVVEDLRFENNNIGGKDDSEKSIDLICNIIFISAYKLQFLNLSANNITAEGAQVLARFFLRSGTTSLKHLDLSMNDLRDRGAEHIAKLLMSGHQEIEHLNVSANGIEWLGALHLAEAISLPTCKVAVLNLAANTVGSQGMVALSAALSLNESLRSLDLSKNEVGDVGIEALTHAWGSSDKGSIHALTALDLSENDITFVGASKLFGVDLDKSAPELTSLSLSKNLICDSGIRKIANLITSRKKLNTLCLETQSSPHKVSEQNQLQLLVKSEIWADDTGITENDCKLIVLSQIRTSTALKNLSKMVMSFCATSHGDASSTIEKHKEQVKRHVGNNIDKRLKSIMAESKMMLLRLSSSMAKLKEEWSRAGKPLSHLNRRELSLQSRKALASLVKCSDEMRSREAKYYLSDHSYTTALTTSLEAKRACIEDFRTQLFSNLLKPLESDPDSRAEDPVKAAFLVAESTLLQEIKCLSMHHVMEYQRLLLKTKSYQNAIEQARQANLSSPLKASLVGDVLQEQKAYIGDWKSTISSSGGKEACELLLAGHMKESVDGFIKVLDARTIEQLNKSIDGRLEEMLKKEEDMDESKRSLTKTWQQFEIYASNRVTGKLEVQVQAQSQVELIQDLCYYRFNLLCHDLERSTGVCCKKDDVEFGSLVRLTPDYHMHADASGGPLEVGEIGVIETKDDTNAIVRTENGRTWWYNYEALEPAGNTSLVIERAEQSQGVGGDLETERDVMDYFEKHPLVKSAWTWNKKLTDLVDMQTGEGQIANLYPQGGETYWREVGWLVHQVIETGVLGVTENLMSEYDELKKARWGGELEEFAVSPPKKQHESLKTRVETLLTERSELVEEAYELCSDLYNLWNTNVKNPGGIITKALYESKATDEGNLYRYLELHRMLGSVIEAMTETAAGDAFVGSSWKNAGITVPDDGVEVHCPGLATALQSGTLEFTREELESHSVSELNKHSYIKVDDAYFQPLDARAEKLKGIAREIRDALPRLNPRSFLKSMNSAVALPIRLAKHRIEAVQNHVKSLFPQEKEGGGSDKEHFTSPEILAMLKGTLQHESDEKNLKLLAKTLPFHMLRSELSDAVSLPVALAASSPVKGKKVSFLQRWHINPGDKSRTFSSVKGHDQPGNIYARSKLDSDFGWAPARNAAGEWMEMDLGDAQFIAGVVTQGCSKKSDMMHQYARVITVEYKRDRGEGWVAAAPSSFGCRSMDEKVEHVFDQPVEARFIKITVREWHGGITLRAGVLERQSETKQGTAMDTHKKICLVHFEGFPPLWCPTDELVDLGEAQRVATLQARLSDGLEKLKQLYTEGGWVSKGEKAVTEAAKRVEKSLHSQAEAWEQAVKKAKDVESSDRFTISNRDTNSQQPVSQWLSTLAKSDGMQHLAGFWNMDVSRATGSICAVESHKWEFLKKFYSDASDFLEKQLQEIEKEAKRQLKWCFLDDSSVLHKSDMMPIWEEKGMTGIDFTESNTVVTGKDTKNSSNALGSRLSPGTLTYHLSMEGGTSGSLIVGVARESVEVNANYKSDTNKHHVILIYSRDGGSPYFDGTWHKDLYGSRSGKANLKSNDKVRIVYDGKSVEFFVNEETESRFCVNDIHDPLRPMVYFSRSGSVRMEFEPKQQTGKKIVLCCGSREGEEQTKQPEGQEQDQTLIQNALEEPLDGPSDGAVRACRPESPCCLCLQEKDGLLKKLLAGLGNELQPLVDRITEGVAEAKLSEQAWETFKKENVSRKVLPSVQEQGRVQAALNRLPAALLAEPQCCQRMTAAVGLLATASSSLPMDKRLADLPFGTRFLVPPFEDVDGTPWLLRCIELLEQGTGFVPGEMRGNKDSAWQDVSSDTVTLSENNTLATTETKGRFNFRGTPFEQGQLVLEIVSFTGKFFAGIALEGHDIGEGPYSPNAVWVWWSGSHWQSFIKGTDKRLDNKSFRAPEPGKDTIRVEYDGVEAKFFLSDEPEPLFSANGLSGPVRPLVRLSDSSGSFRIVNNKEAAAPPDRLSFERATEALALDTVRGMSPWEARVFGSVCVSPYALSTLSGSLAIQQLAASQLFSVTLAVSDVTAQGAAFLAHFVARCCRSQVRVRIEPDDAKGTAQHVMLSPGGGLEAHVRKDTTQSATTARDRLLFLSGMGVGVEALRVLMEAALAGLQEAAPRLKEASAISATDAAAGDSSAVVGSLGGAKSTPAGLIAQASDERPATCSSPEFKKMLASLDSLTASKTKPVSLPQAEGGGLVHAVEMDDNPMIGAARGTAMALIVKMVHMASGQSLVRLHLANSHIEDEGVRVLSRAFVRDSFAPRLRTLWLSDNRITDVGTQDIGHALATSLKCLTEIFLFRNKFTANGKATLRKTSSDRTQTLTMHL